MSELSSAFQPETGESLSLLGIHDLIKENGCYTLHLLPFHPDLNPAKLMWGDIKTE
jgi:hypothetical protein